MTAARSVINLALRYSGVVGVGQTPLAEDVNDSLVLLNSMIGQWQRQRAVQVIPGVLDTFPSLFTDVPSWTGQENVLLVALAERLRAAYGLPPDEQISKAADSAVQLLQANNLHQQPPDLPGLATTCGHVVRLALRACGRVNDAQGVSDASQDMADGMALLVSMLAQWQRQRWLVPHLTEAVLLSTGAASYGIGPGEAFDTSRPVRIDSAFVRLMSSPGPVRLDYPLVVIESREDYSEISLKNMTTLPAAVFLDTGWPTGTVYVWPVPTASLYELHLFTAAALPVYAAPTDPLGLPPEYTDAVVYNLALRVAAATASQVSPGVLALARATLETVRGANAQMKNLDLPPGLAGRNTPTAARLIGGWI
jgi:hypothetical protein